MWFFCGVRYIRYYVLLLLYTLLRGILKYDCEGDLGPVQTSNFTCAESNANERKQ